MAQYMVPFYNTMRTFLDCNLNANWKRYFEISKQGKDVMGVDNNPFSIARVNMATTNVSKLAYLIIKVDLSLIG